MLIWQQIKGGNERHSYAKPVYHHFCKMNYVDLTRDCDIYSSDQLQ